MRQCHGVTDARKLVGRKSDGEQRVLTVDGDGEVELEISSSFPTGLTPDQARWLAQLLCESADRVEAKTQEEIRELDEMTDDAPTKDSLVGGHSDVTA